MKKCISQSLTIKFPIILSIIIGSLYSSRIAAQKTPQMFALPLPFKQCWSYQTKMTNHQIASDNKVSLIIPILDGKLLALDSNSGEKLWETELGGEIVSNIVNDETGENDEEDKNIYVATKPFLTTDDNIKKSMFDFSNKRNHLITVKLRSLGGNTGITNWQTSLLISESETRKVFIFVYNHKIIMASQSGDIIALNKTNGEILWKRSLNLVSSNTRFDLQDKNLTILAGHEIILADLETGKYIFQKETNSNLTAVYFFNKTILIMGNKRGEIYALDVHTKKYIWKSRVGAEVSNISFTPKGILVSSFDNFIYLIATESGRGIWKRRLENRLVIEPFLFDNYVIVMTLGSSKANILDLDEGRLVNQIFLPADNYFINRPVFNNHLVIFPTSDGIFAFTNSDNKCNGEQK